MFKNSGKKVKTLAKVIFWLTIVAFVILGIISIVTGAALNRSYRGTGTPSIISGVIMIPIGVLVGWLGSLVYYAIGVAADESEHNSFEIANINNKLDRIYSFVANNNNEVMKQSSNTYDNSTQIPSLQKASTQLTCQNCGTNNNVENCYVDVNYDGNYSHFSLCNDCYNRINKPKRK